MTEITKNLQKIEITIKENRKNGFDMDNFVNVFAELVKTDLKIDEKTDQSKQFEDYNTKT